MANATGSLRELIYAQEWEYGTERATESNIYKALRNTGDSINLSKNTTASSELSGDRAIRYLRHGNETVSGDISLEFAPSAFDELLAASIGGTWGTASASAVLTLETNPTDGDTITIGSRTLTFVTAKTDKFDVLIGATVADTQDNLSLAIDTYCTPAVIGDWAANSATITARYPGTWANSVATVTSLTDLTDGFDVTKLTGGVDGNVVKQGNALFTYAIEKGFTDIDQYMLYRGCAINSFSLDISTDAVVTGSFSFIGAGSGDAQIASVETGTVTPAGLDEPFQSFNTEVLIDGIDDCVVTSLNMSVDNGITANYVVCGPEAVSVTHDRVNVTGNLTILFEDAKQISKFIDEGAVSLQVTLTNGGDSYIFKLPKIKYTGGDIPVNGGGVVTISLPFQALYDDTENSAIVITRSLT